MRARWEGSGRREGVIATNRASPWWWPSTNPVSGIAGGVHSVPEPDTGPPVCLNDPDLAGPRFPLLMNPLTGSVPPARPRAPISPTSRGPRPGTSSGSAGATARAASPQGLGGGELLALREVHGRRERLHRGNSYCRMICYRRRQWGESQTPARPPSAASSATNALAQVAAITIWVYERTHG